ncbi:MAG: hypothetical protein ACRDO4_03085, partial [Nocardioides sp.]
MTSHPAFGSRILPCDDTAAGYDEAPEPWLGGFVQIDRSETGGDHFVILVTRPAPTVRPPSR